jgi:hypothetical protein
VASHADDCAPGAYWKPVLGLKDPRLQPHAVQLPSAATWYPDPGCGVTVQLDVPLHARVLHASLTQLTGSPAQTPLALQASPKVHAFPSSHTVPTGAFGFEQMPVLGSHVPAT